MKPTAIGAPAPEPDDDPTLAELIARLKRREAWALLREISDRIPEAPMGPEIPGLGSK